MVRIEVRYEGGLRCEATHGPSGSRLLTDAPADNQGKGEAFSPTDLVATALATCVVTTMGIVAARHDWDLEGTQVSVDKEMVADPARRIGRLDVVVRVPGTFDEKARRALEAAAHGCPVHKSLGERVEAPLTFEWGAPVRTA